MEDSTPENVAASLAAGEPANPATEAAPSHLITVSKDGVEIEIDPSTKAAHNAAGWK